MTPYELAKTHLGTREIPGKNHCPLIVRWLRMVSTAIHDDETPWCSAFVNAMAMEAGYERSGKLNARSWLGIGERIELKKAQRGDVVILWRGSPGSWQGHVAFFDFHHQVTGNLYLLGGNQSNEVNITAYDPTKVLGVRRLRSLECLEHKS